MMVIQPYDRISRKSGVSLAGSGCDHPCRSSAYTRESLRISTQMITNRQREMAISSGWLIA